MERPGLEYDCTFPEDCWCNSPCCPLHWGCSIVPKIRGVVSNPCIHKIRPELVKLFTIASLVEICTDIWNPLGDYFLDGDDSQNIHEAPFNPNKLVHHFLGMRKSNIFLRSACFQWNKHPINAASGNVLRAAFLIRRACSKSAVKVLSLSRPSLEKRIAFMAETYKSSSLAGRRT